MIIYVYVCALQGAGVGKGSSLDPLQVPQYQPQGRWAAHADPSGIRSVLETRSLQLAVSDTPSRAEEEDGDEDHHAQDDVDFHPQSLDSLLDVEDDSEALDEEGNVCNVEVK